MEITLVMGLDGNILEWVQKLNISIYGLNQANINWLGLIMTGLDRRGYHQYKLNPYVFYRKDSVILTYVDDCIIV